MSSLESLHCRCDNSSSGSHDLRPARRASKIGLAGADRSRHTPCAEAAAHGVCRLLSRMCRSEGRMVEVEQKFRDVDFAVLERRLRELGAVEGKQREEADHYFNAPDRDFARTDEALRIRRIGSANCVTYKGPKRDLQTKTRTEIEVPL